MDLVFRFIYSGSADGEIVMYDTLSDAVVTLRGHEDVVRDVAWHPYQALLLSR